MNFLKCKDLSFLRLMWIRVNEKDERERSIEEYLREIIDEIF